MKLIDYLREDLIDPDLRPRDKADCLRQMAERASRAGVIRDLEESLKSLLEREKVVTTGIGNGVAIPHAKSANVHGMVIAVGRVAEGLDFEALDGQPVHILFMLLGPQEAAGLHVKLLARIARLVKQPDFLKRLREAQTAPDLYQVIREEDERQP
jgi:PTS system nitrogen regulatory IIA component